MKSIDTLVPDILGLFENGHLPTLDDPDFGGIVGRRLREKLEPGDHRGLRLSALGKRDKQLWYDVNRPDLKEPLSANARFKFLYGDILEALLLHLAQEAGHTVEKQQAEVRVEGIVGHIDAVIDGVLVDVKSANTRGFDTFTQGLETVRQDVFLGSYLAQLAGYSHALDGLDGAFLVVDKQLGKLTLLRVSAEYLRDLNIRGRIEHLKTLVAAPAPPDEPCPSAEFGKSGNRVLAAPCSYCPYKQHCCKDANGGIGLRSFRYANGVKHFTTVVEEPRVFEIIHKENNADNE